MTIDELITKLEKADGPSRELDAEIARAVGYDVRTDRAMPGRFFFEPVKGESWKDVPPYVSSIDAALTLAPENDDREYRVVIWTGYRPAARVLYRVPDATAEGGYAHGALNDWEVRGATPALAVCIASLRARQAKEPA